MLTLLTYQSNVLLQILENLFQGFLLS